MGYNGLIYCGYMHILWKQANNGVYFHEETDPSHLLCVILLLGLVLAAVLTKYLTQFRQISLHFENTGPNLTKNRPYSGLPANIDLTKSHAISLKIMLFRCLLKELAFKCCKYGPFRAIQAKMRPHGISLNLTPFWPFQVHLKGVC